LNSGGITIEIALARAENEKPTLFKELINGHEYKGGD